MAKKKIDKELPSTNEENKTGEDLGLSTNNPEDMALIQEDPPLEENTDLTEGNPGDEDVLGEEDVNINVQELRDQAMYQGEITENEEIKKQEEEIAVTAVSEPAGAINPLRMYDEKERQVSMEALQMIYDARNPLHRGVLKFPAVDIGEYRGERCLIIFIPDIQNGVEGILPESKAGLRKGQKLESLMRLPFLRVTPEDIYRDEGRCILNRELAEKIEAQRTWKSVSEGNDVDAIVMGIKRDPQHDHRPIYILLDVGGIYSKMPISEVSHNYVYDVKFTRGEILKVRVNQKVESIPPDGQEPVRKFKVSLKAREFNPWYEERYIPKIGQGYPGTVTYNSEKWLHVKLASGIEVLAPRPSLNYEAREKLTTVGNRVYIYITKIDRDKHFVRGNFDFREAMREIQYFSRRQLAQQKA